MKARLRRLFSELANEVESAENFYEVGLAYESGLALERANKLIAVLAVEVEK